MNLELLKEIAYPIVGVLHDVHSELGPGLNESVYQEGLEKELTFQEIPFKRENTFHPIYKGEQMDAIFRMDFTCLDIVIIECKAVEKLNNEHRAQLFNYLRLTKHRIGILVNFATSFMQIERYFYDPEKNEILTYNGDIIEV